MSEREYGETTWRPPTLNEIKKNGVFPKQPMAVRVPYLRPGKGRPTVPSYDKIYEDMYGLANVETYPIQNPNNNNLGSVPDIPSVTAPIANIARNIWGIQGDCSTDTKIAQAQIQRGKKNQAAMVFNSINKRNTAQKYYEDELEANERREWWVQDSPTEDDSLYRMYKQGYNQSINPSGNPNAGVIRRPY